MPGLKEFKLSHFLEQNFNPNIILGLVVIFSFGFLLALQIFSLLAFVMLVLIIVFDIMAWLIVRKNKEQDDYIARATSARISEGIVFMMFTPWFFLFALNCLITVFSIRRNRAFELPLRYVFPVYFVFAHMGV